MASGAVFPAFIRATYQETSDGVPAFERAMQTSVNRARKAAEISMEDLQREVQRAVVGGRSDFGIPEMRAAAAAADGRAQSARQLANALAAAAAAEADYSAVTQVSIVTARRLADEEEHAARSAHLHVAAVEQMADAARRNNIDMTALASGQIMAARSSNAHRQAQMMLGQQMQDTAIMLQLGMNPLMILTQQGTQAAFALSQMGGRAAAVGRILSSPWTAALLIAGTALSALIGKSEDAADALEKVKFSSDSVGNAQSILGNVMDITTGKISTQRQELIALAIAQAKVAAIQAQARAVALRGEVEGLQRPTWSLSGGMGGGFDVERRPAGAVGAISKAFLTGEIDTTTAVQRLDNLRKAGALTDEAFAEAAKSVASLGVELANQKTFEAAERLARQAGTASDRALLLKPKDDRSSKSKANALAEFGETAAERIQRINEAFDDQPRLIDRAAQATRELDDLIGDLERRKPAGYEGLIAQANEAKAVVKDGLVRPYDDFIARQREQLVIGDLLLDGRRNEAEAVRQILGMQRDMGPLDAARRQAIVDSVQALDQQAKSMERLQAEQQAFLAASSSIQSSIQQSIASIRADGFGALGGLVNNVMGTFDNLLSDVVSEQLFGDIFRGINDEIRAATGVKSASEVVNDALMLMATKVEATGNALAAVTNEIAGGPVAAANDNGAQQAYADIVVNGRKAIGDPVTFMETTFTRLLAKALPEDQAKNIGKEVAAAVQGAAYGQTAGGLIFGSGNDRLGSAIGGAIGNKVGEKVLGKGLETIAKGLGDFAGPLGSIAGGILGGAIGGMFTSAKWGTAAVTGNADSDVSVGGNKSAYRSNAGLAGTSIQSGLDAIAEQFGADVGGYNVSIGQYKGKWRVSTTGRTGKLKGGSGRTDIKDFGENGAEDAIKYAIADAVKDGALEGLRASTQALLAASDDVEAQLQKALDFEDVFSRLKSYKDPVGAALDTLDKEFKRLRGIFEEAGASAEEYAQLEELYGIERAAAVKEAAEKVTASLKSLFDDLTVGNDARSLRDRLVEAQANYDPLAQRVAAGDTTAYDDYADAAQTLLDLQRQIYGSSEDYFKLLDEVTGLTKSRIDAEGNIASISEARPGLFASDMSLAPMVSATETQTATLVSVMKTELGAQTSELKAISTNIIALVRTVSGQSGSGSKQEALVARSNF
ncbi:hypothetical protein [Sphingobium lactosutens]|uniref:hypothetical protein n=1 Tax=Sphingobium lactosutens TaxID=522773 RepID=UPI0021189A64|nr:hypothetical protein [Sphingobium lactosutens]